MYGGFAGCWYWPLVISRSTQPTDALATAMITSRGPSDSGAGISTSDACSIAASGSAAIADDDDLAAGRQHFDFAGGAHGSPWNTPPFFSSSSI